MKFYNTLTKKKEDFVPIVEGKIGMYCCGPTVYNDIHVGNARPLVVFDTLRRYLIYKGYDVKYVVNFTDIDDKIINRANGEKVQFTEITEKYINEYKIVAEALGAYDFDVINPKATEFIPQIIDFISGLEKKGAAYAVNGNVYFDISKAKDYGKLSKKNIKDLLSGARVEINDEKKSPLDFVLWKSKKEGEPYWESPWGDGRPGWHIECSVMNSTIIGETIDIHAGGEDLQFPHHENEIAQSETLFEKTFVNYWLHNGMITIDNSKMSKSLGNFFTVKDFGKVYDLEVLRFFLLSVHYRKPINYSKEIIEQMKNSLDRIHNCRNNLEFLIEKCENKEIISDEIKLLEDLERQEEHFKTAMDDDLNTADAITAMFEIVRLANSSLSDNSSKEVVQKTYDKLIKLSNILGFLRKKEELLDGEIQKLINERTEARQNKDFKRSDEIRDLLKNQGIVLEDTKEGVKWKRV